MWEWDPIVQKRNEGIGAARCGARPFSLGLLSSAKHGPREKGTVPCAHSCFAHHSNGSRSPLSIVPLQLGNMLDELDGDLEDLQFFVGQRPGFEPEPERIGVRWLIHD